MKAETTSNLQPIEANLMNFYTRQHKYYCGIDLHARKMYVYVFNQQGAEQLHKNIDTDPTLFLELIAPYQEDVIVGMECVFCWYWLADLCASLLRRHAATYASRSGTPIEIVSKVILRQADLSTTRRYLGKVNDTEAIRWIETL